MVLALLLLLLLLNKIKEGYTITDGTVRCGTSRLTHITCGNKNKPNADRDKKARSLTWKGRQIMTSPTRNT